ncbi:hypothetical protein B0H99_10468 [Planomicrobium soli]|uniref:Uncharacterized protein n=1 Tax=Planomicrobium soli TaxID=1176648 RepID=A0A2P8H313_9BACL|nr:hypothetical protein [Planomicrobium soli]PSL40606.1 hypothetical protein B0H99_10468 [Planomicrobium soli]
MAKLTHYMIFIFCIILIFVLYGRALGSIPFLILSFYLFYFSWSQLYSRKKKTR